MNIELSNYCLGTLSSSKCRENGQQTYTNNHECLFTSLRLNKIDLIVFRSRLASFILKKVIMIFFMVKSRPLHSVHISNERIRVIHIFFKSI